MKFKTGKSGTIIMYDLKQRDILNILKLQARMRLIFVSPTIKEPVGSIYLLDRTVKNNHQMIGISERLDGKIENVVEYGTLIGKIAAYIEKYECQIVIASEVFYAKQPLIAIISDIKDEIIDGCVYIDYNNGMFSLINKPMNNMPNRLYYWEENNSLFVFGTSGPSLQFETKYESIEDIICR